MKYICLGYIEPGKFEGMTGGERQATFDDCFEYNDHLRANGHLVAEVPLQPPETALTLYWKNGKVTTTDGPYAETKEQVGGIQILEARDLNLVPAWMSAEIARSAVLTACPRLSVDRLMELRRQLDSLQASRGESTPQAGGDHATKTETTARLVRRRETNSGSPDHPEGHRCSPHRRASGRGGRRRQDKDERRLSKREGT